MSPPAFFSHVFKTPVSPQVLMARRDGAARGRGLCSLRMRGWEKEKTQVLLRQGLSSYSLLVLQLLGPLSY